MYNFKKDIQVYVEYDGFLIPIDVYPDITFSQTYNENENKMRRLPTERIPKGNYRIVIVKRKGRFYVLKKHR